MYDFYRLLIIKGNMNLPLHPYLPNVKCVMYYESATGKCSMKLRLQSCLLTVNCIMYFVLLLQSKNLRLQSNLLVVLLITGTKIRAPMTK